MTYTCTNCGKSFFSPYPRWKAPKTCSPECLKARLQQSSKNAHGKRWANNKAVVSTCEVCRVEFVGLAKSKTYKSCPAPECRKEIRRRTGLANHEAKRKAKKPQARKCLGWCNQTFVPRGVEHFCPECQSLQRQNRGAEFW